MIEQFNFARIPNIKFGAGKFQELWDLIPKFGKNILFIIGKNSLKNSGKWEDISHKLEERHFNFSHVSISGEPSPLVIDNITSEFRSESIDLIIGIGGGSVIDAGKAISAMLTKEDSIKDYLEGVGTKQHDGLKIPYIAIPRTSGTGSEATKNAVISHIGPDGFKKSLRHDNFVPDIAIIDPELMLTCPSSISAACGMDAFTQLLESYVSSKANPMTDVLAYNGMKYIKDNLILACTTGAKDINIRSAMAYGSLLSGITLANAGLGIVHGLASQIGGLFEIPHGIVCGTLIAEATKININKLRQQDSKGYAHLKKYAEIGALMDGKKIIIKEENLFKSLDILVDTLENWSNTLNIEKLGKFGISKNEVNKIAESAGLKNNPVNLNSDDIKKIVLKRL